MKIITGHTLLCLPVKTCRLVWIPGSHILRSLAVFLRKQTFPENGSSSGFCSWSDRRSAYIDNSYRLDNNLAVFRCCEANKETGGDFASTRAATSITPSSSIHRASIIGVISTFELNIGVLTGTEF